MVAGSFHVPSAKLSQLHSDAQQSYLLLTGVDFTKAVGKAKVMVDGRYY